MKEKLRIIKASVYSIIILPVLSSCIINTYAQCTITISGTSNAATCENENYTYNATISSSGTTVPIYWSLDFGDGTPVVQDSLFGSGPWGISENHTYTSSGTYTVILTSNDPSDLGSSLIVDKSFASQTTETGDLAWDGTNLWQVSNLPIPAVIYEINPATGALISSFNAPDGGGTYSCYGLTYDGTYLWVGGSGTVPAPGSYIYKINTVGAIIGGPYLTHNQNAGCTTAGLGWEGANNLWEASEGGIGLDSAYVTNITSWNNTINGFLLPRPWQEGAAYDEIHDIFWVSSYDGADPRIFGLNPVSGVVEHSFASPGSSPHGLAFDGTCLWHSDRSADLIYRLCFPVDVPGCSDADTITVTVNPVPSVDLGTDQGACTGDIITLDAGFGDSYLWNDASTNQTLDVTSSGTYYVTVTTGGCTGSDTADVTFKTYPIVNLGTDTTLCGGDSIILDAGTGDSYLWNDASVNQTLNIASTGTYYVTVTNGFVETIFLETFPNLADPWDGTGQDNTWTVQTGEADDIKINDTGIAANPPHLYFEDCDDAWSSGWEYTSIDLSGYSSVDIEYYVKIIDNDNINEGIRSEYSPDGGISWYMMYEHVDTDIPWTLDHFDLPDIDATANFVLRFNAAGSSSGDQSYIDDVKITGTSVSSGCLGTDTINVTFSPGLTVDLGADTTVCTGVTITLDAGAGDSYIWNDASTNQTLDATATGTYYVTVTSGSCTGSDTINVTFSPGLTVDLGADTSACVGDTITLDAGAGDSYVWNDASTNQTLDVTATGTYYVTVTSGSCTGSDTINVTFSLGLTVDLGADTSACAGDTITLDAGAGDSYLWNDTSTNQALDVTATGTYYVTVTSGSCTGSDTINITISPVLSIIMNSDSTACAGDSNGTATVTVSGGTAPYTYAWSNGCSSSSCTGLTAGSYWVSITDASGCDDSASVTVFEPSALVITTTTSPSECGASNGQACVDTVTGGTPPYSYSWSNGDTTSCTDTILASGSYTITVTDFNGCNDTAVTSVSDLGAPAASITSQVNVSCFGACDGQATVTITGGSMPFSVIWSNGDNLSGIDTGSYSTTTGLCVGALMVGVIDSAGCTISDNTTITQPAQLSISVDSIQNVSCWSVSDGAVYTTTAGGTGPYSYSWTNTLQSTDDIVNVTANTYDVTATDDNGCTAINSATITEPTPLFVNVNITDASAPGACDGSFDLIVSGGTTPYSFYWDTGDTTEDISNLCAGIYSVDITDSNGCYVQGIFDIEEPGCSLAASITSQNNASCYGACDGQVTVTITNGIAPFNIVWSNGDSISGADTGSFTTTTGLCVGVVSVTITDSTGCIASYNTTISEPAQLSISISISTGINCKGDSTGMASATVSGGTSPYSYQWNDYNSQTDSSATGLPAGSYTVVIYDTNGCSGTDSITISEPPQLNITTGSQSATCGNNDGSAWVIVSGGTSPYTFLWNDPLSQTTDTAINLLPGAYTATVTDANGCQLYGSVIVGDTTLITNAGPDTSICFGNSVQLYASGGDSYNWNPDSSLNDSAISNPIGSPSTTTTYVVIISAGSCLPDTLYVTIMVNPLPIASAEDDATITQGESVQLSGSGGVDYSWSPSNGLSCTNCQNPIATPEESTTYYLAVTDAAGCTDTNSVNITVIAGEIFVPNIFSPDGDDLNDVLYVFGSGIKEMEFTIYDRWGEKVFESNAQEKGWDGTCKGKELNPAVFVYYLKITDIEGNTDTRSGNITLVR
ncbi:MAG: gliding motility-associated C-terminal domain-containing protein [Bacteroidota bacterium]